LPNNKIIGEWVDQMIPPRLLSLPQAASYIGHSPKWFYERTTTKGKERLPFKPKRVGKRIFFDRKQIDVWIDELGEDGNDEEGNRDATE
jgi:predicted DNA-binding transcriptional regulator AlpA